MSKLVERYVLLKECLEVLNTSLLPEDESDRLSLLFEQIVPMTDWWKVDWNKIDQKIEIGYNPKDIIPALEKLLKTNIIDKSGYIQWSNFCLPIIKTDLDKVIEFFDKVVCVDFEKFIFNPCTGYIIEILPSALMTVGLIDAKKG